MELTEDEVLQILKLLDESDFDELHLEVGDLKLSVSKSGAMERTQSEPRPVPPPAPPKAKAAPPAPPEPKASSPATREDVPSATAVEAGLAPIKAPMLGTFYSRPDPGSPPYVEVGKLVRPDDTVGLIEVMKLFTSVKAGVQGRISQICVQSGQLVEYGQTLFLVKPEETPGT